MTTVSEKDHLRETLQFVQSLLIKDLQAVSADKTSVSPGGAARPALSLVAECAAINHAVAARLETGTFPESPTPEARLAFLNSFDTVEKAVAFLTQETAYLVQAVEGFDETKFGDKVQTPLGVEMSVFGLANFAAMHMMYHDGQLNYIHSLHGDAEMHW